MHHHQQLRCIRHEPNVIEVRLPPRLLQRRDSNVYCAGSNDTPRTCVERCAKKPAQPCKGAEALQALISRLSSNKPLDGTGGEHLSTQRRVGLRGSRAHERFREAEQLEALPNLVRCSRRAQSNAQGRDRRRLVFWRHRIQGAKEA